MHPEINALKLREWCTIMKFLEVCRLESLAWDNNFVPNLNNFVIDFGVCNCYFNFIYIFIAEVLYVEHLQKTKS